MLKQNKYIPSEEAVKFIAFIKATGIEDNDTPEMHYMLADKYFHKHKRIMIEAHRGSAKSTIMEWLVIYVAVLGKLHNFGNVDFIAFIGDSAENGVKNFFRNINTKIEKSKFLQQYLTVARMTLDEAELINAQGKKLRLKGFGMKKNIRGVRYEGIRPDIIILDDVTGNDAESSDVIQQTIEDNFYKAILPALHPTKFRLYVIGTPISEKDLLSKLRDNSKWLVHKFPVAEKFPCSEEEFKGNWEDRFPYEAVMEQYETYKEDGKEQAFFQEYMLIIADLSTLIINEHEDIKWFDPDLVLKQKHNYNIYITTDFATTVKKHSDYSTIGVFAINNNNDWLLVDGQAKKQVMSDTINDLFEFVRKWDPLSVGIETSGQQGGFISLIQEQMATRNNWFTFAKKRGSKEEGIRPAKDKLHRFNTGVQPKFKQHKVYLPKPDTIKVSNYRFYGLLEELLNEFRNFTRSAGVQGLKHDDALDLFNQFSEMEKFIPSKDEYREEKIENKTYNPFGTNKTERIKTIKNNLIF